MNDENPVPRVPDNFAADHDTRSGGWSFLRELGRDRAFGTDPRCSRLWPLAPAQLKRDYCYGYCDALEFWRALEQWIRFEKRCERGRAA